MLEAEPLPQTRADRPSGRPRLRYAIKAAVASALYYVGLLHLWQAIVLRRKAVVLMYHRVLTPEERHGSGSHPGIVVDRETFARHMALLKRRFVVLSAEEFAERLERRIPFPSSSCLITFDDGWRDNFTNALPVLAHHALPALIFLPVNYMGDTRLFWQEALVHLLMRAVGEARRDPARRGRLADLLKEFALDHVLEIGGAEPRTAIVEAVGTIKHLAASRIAALVSALEAELGVAVGSLAGSDSFMDWDQVQTMSRHRVAFGGHGAEHRLLTQIPSVDAQAEIATARRVIENRLGAAVPAFAYPNGAWTPEVARIVKAAGYRLAFTTNPGHVTCHDDPFTLRRVNVHEDMTHTAPMFLARLVGLF